MSTHSATDPLIGRVFDRRYLVERKLGAGGMADVYLAEDQSLGRRVAIKILNDRHAHDEQFVERFRREASSAAALSHPNIVAIYDRGEAEGTYYIAMEYLDGRSVKESITRAGPLPVALAIDYARQILAAVGHAHRTGIVHRDIKPHNVLLAGEGRVKVTDFGIARSGGASQMTEVGSIIGTAQYLSPEQARGAPVDERSDLYSVGIVLYEMLTGTVPFTGDTALEIAMKHLSDVPEPPSRRRGGVPADLDRVVLRALAKRPHDRYSSAEEFDADLARVARGIAVAPETAEAATQVLRGVGALEVGERTMVAHAPTAVVPPPREPYTRRSYAYTPPRRRRAPVWPWLLAVLVLGAGGVGGWYLYERIQNELNANKPATVGYYVGLREKLALAKIRDDALRARVRRHSSETVDPGFVMSQAPPAGEKIDRGNSVTVVVSTGKPKVAVPSVVGKSVAAAVEALTQVGLDPNPVDINSAEAPGTVTAQGVKAGTQVVQGTKVRINVSQGPKPVEIPGIVGATYEDARQRLTALGFSVSRTDVDSEQDQGTVVRAIPAPGSEAPAGSTVELLVAKGVTKFAVPDVTTLDRKTALDTLRNAGFRVETTMQETLDPSQQGVVLNQDPIGGTEIDPTQPVTLFVGEYAGPPTTAEATTTGPDATATDTTATDTTATDTTATDTTATDTTATDTTATDTTATDTTVTDTTATDTTATDTTVTDTTATDTTATDTTAPAPVGAGSPVR